MSTKKNAAAQTAGTTTAPATTDGAAPTTRGARRSRRGLLEKINAKFVAFNQFARKWEATFADTAASKTTSDVQKSAAKNVAEQFSAIVAATDKASRELELLKTNGWKAPKPRGKADHRQGDTVDMKSSRVKLFVKAGFKPEKLRGFTVGNVLGSMVHVDNGNLSGTYPGGWFVRAAAPAAAAE